MSVGPPIHGIHLPGDLSIPADMVLVPREVLQITYQLACAHLQNAVHRSDASYGDFMAALLIVDDLLDGDDK